MRQPKDSIWYCGWLITLSGAMVGFSGLLVWLANQGIWLAVLAALTGIAMMFLGGCVTYGNRVVVVYEEKEAPIAANNTDNHKI